VPSERIGRYEILETLGRGGQAVVYRAYDPVMQREVALKVLSLATSEENQAARERFEREAHTIAALEHPTIVPVYDFGADDAGLFIVMRLMKGGSLAERLQKGALNPAEILAILKNVASALDAAHARGIVHRDIKPANILFDEYDTAYLSDFGIARLSTVASSLTGSLILGTPYYMSPEQINGVKDIDGRSDVYALGALLFQMLTGHVPYESETPAQAIVKHLQEPVPEIAAYRADLPAVYQQIVARAMAKERQQRYPTAGALMQDFEAAVHGKPLANMPTLQIEPSSLATTQAVQPKRFARRGLWMTLAAFVALAAFAGSAWVAWRLWGQKAFAPPPSPTPLPATTTIPPLQVTTAIPALAPTTTPSPTPSTSPTSPPTPLMATSTPALSPTPSLGGPVVGGADLFALALNGDIWFLATNGRARRVTTDGGDKHGLQWLSPDKLLYINGKCVFILSTNTLKPRPLLCFNNIDSLDAFRVSPDGQQVAIVLDNELFVVSYDLQTLGAHRDPELLPNMPGFCARFVKDSIHEVLWSSDGKLLAARATVPIGNGRSGDQIEVLNPVCGEGIYRQHIFPGRRFPMRTYEQVPRITSFDWDGDKQFVFTLYWRNGSFGDMYLYSRGTYTGERIQPVMTSHCCYASPRWSPDGTYLFFAFQDINDPKGKVFFYNIPAGTIGAGIAYQPLKLKASRLPLGHVLIEVAPHPAP